MKTIIKIRIILWLSLSVAVIFLMHKTIVPGGVTTYRHDFKNFDYFIGKLTPQERVFKINDVYTMIGDPVYFNLRIPRHFDTAKLTLVFQNQSDRKLIEAGLLTDKTVWRYDLEPISNDLLDGLFDKWSVLFGEDDKILFQREKIYSSVNDFLSQPPAIEKIAQYNYNLPNNFVLHGYQASDRRTEVSHAFRGTYQFYIYLKNEKLDIDFSLKDLNKNKDSDQILVNLYYDGQLLSQRSLADDGVVSDNGKESSVRFLRLVEEGLPEGAYKIEVMANDDIVTEKIRSAQDRMVFLNGFWLVDNGSFKLYTNSRELRIKTTNPSSLQAVLFDGKTMEIDQTYKQFSFATEKKTTEVVFAKGDLMLAGDGVFSFQSEKMFNPVITKVDANFNADQSAVDFIIAKYKRPDSDELFQTATAWFDLANAYQESGTYSFVLSVPGLKAETEKQGVIIKEVTIDLFGKGLAEKLKDLMGKL